MGANAKDQKYAKLYKPHVDDELFDDACDLGQFLLNPTWYLYLKVTSTLRESLRQSRSLRDEQAKARTKAPSWIYLQQPLYFTFLFAGWSAVFLKVYPSIRTCDDLSSIHLSFGYVVFLACITSWKYASSTHPGDITTETMRKFDNYQYDNLLYQESSICPTLNHRKIARSKFDRFTKKHVPRFDHYCGWLRQPIGEENYRQFLLFVMVHALMCGYGSVLISVIVFGTREETGVTARISEFLHDPILTLIMCFLGLVCVTLTSFFGFHMYLIASGMTTNEYYKWKLVISRHQAATTQYLKSLREGIAKEDEESSLSRSVINPGPIPANFYDQGLLNNFLEVIFPRSLFGTQYKHD